MNLAVSGNAFLFTKKSLHDVVLAFDKLLLALRASSSHFKDFHSAQQLISPPCFAALTNALCAAVLPLDSQCISVSLYSKLVILLDHYDM